MHDLVAAVSPAEARLAAGHLAGGLSAAVGRLAATLRDLHLRLEASIDFPDEGYRFIDRDATAEALTRLRDELRAIVDGGARARRLRDGHLVVVAGAPNVGKSSVFNALVGHERAIVTPVAGTTRDLVSEHVLDRRRAPPARRHGRRAGQRRSGGAGGHPARDGGRRRCRSGPGGARSFARAWLGRSRRAGGDCRPSAVDRRQQGRPGAGVGGGRSRRGAVDLGASTAPASTSWPASWRRTPPRTGSLPIRSSPTPASWRCWVRRSITSKRRARRWPRPAARFPRSS